MGKLETILIIMVHNQTSGRGNTSSLQFSCQNKYTQYFMYKLSIFYTGFTSTKLYFNIPILPDIHRDSHLSATDKMFPWKWCLQIGVNCVNTCKSIFTIALKFVLHKSLKLSIKQLSFIFYIGQIIWNFKT